MICRDNMYSCWTQWAGVKCKLSAALTVRLVWWLQTIITGLTSTIAKCSVQLSPGGLLTRPPSQLWITASAKSLNVGHLCLSHCRVMSPGGYLRFWSRAFSTPSRSPGLISFLLTISFSIFSAMVARVRSSQSKIVTPWWRKGLEKGERLRMAF